MSECNHDPSWRKPLNKPKRSTQESRNAARKKIDADEQHDAAWRREVNYEIDRRKNAEQDLARVKDELNGEINRLRSNWEIAEARCKRVELLGRRVIDTFL